MNSNLNEEEQVAKHWYHEPWAWFILSPIIVVMIVSSITVTIAVRYADDRVIDNYYKEGRMINMRQDEDLLAQSLDMNAQFRFDQSVNEIVLFLTNTENQFPAVLRLDLSHPVESSLDTSVTLHHIKDGHYQAEFDTASLKNRWYIRLSSIANDTNQVSESNKNYENDQAVSNKWRLRGEIDFSKTNQLVLSANS
jgi:hypothetical protein